MPVERVRSVTGTASKGRPAAQAVVPRGGRRAALQGEFTLLELLVVISIMALATAGVSLAIRDSGEQQLEREAQRLATLLESARAQARTNGALVVWRPLPQGFRFEGLPPNVKMPTQWLQTPVLVQPNTPVVLGPEPLIPRQSITLSLPGSNSAPLRLATDGLRPFSIQSLQVTP
ncbi:hypothetical protein CTYAZ2_43630 [Comamonas testosteroni]|nr:hypothetical protein CTYAZ2_43630 [Comamonas testosteroni]